MARGRDREPVPRRRGRIALLLFLLALSLLALVVLRAYRARQLDLLVTEVPLLRADPLPIRERPADPGGMEVPHQDKLIFQSLDEGPVEPVVERLLPPPEEPLRRPEAPAPGVAALPEQAPPLAAPAPQPAAATPARPEVVPPVPEPPEAPAEADSVAALAPAPQAPPNPALGFRVQVGAYRTPEDAARGWLEAMAVAPELLGPLRHFVARADLGPRGVFHRLQLGPLPSAASADSLCGQLKERGVDCFVVAP
jgi:hypothetical protein